MSGKINIFCVECAKAHELNECVTSDFLGGTSYYCPKTIKEIAREKDGELFAWNGREFRDVKK